MHLLRHIYEAIDRAKEVAIEDLIGEVVLMGLHIVDLTDHLRMLVATRKTRYGAKAWSHEGRPVLHQHDVGSLAAQTSAHTPPRQRVDGRHTSLDAKIFRGWSIHRLALAREKQ